MMCLLLKKDNNVIKYKKNIYIVFFVLFFTSSCGFMSRDPVNVYNKKFLKKYEKVIAGQRDRHKQIARENNIFYGFRKNPDDDLESMRRRDELNREFLEKYKKQDEIDEETKNIEVSYLDYNHGEYIKKITASRVYGDKYSYFNKDTYKNKSFNYIDYSEIQTSYDYITLLKKLRQEHFAEELRIKEAKRLEEQGLQKDENGVISAIKKVKISNMKERFRNLFKNKNK